MSKSATLDEFFEKDDRNTNSGSGISHELRFTGNWFIDAGILGFVNLMEEVYGWDLDELQERIKENPELVYYWYFPIGYICHVVREAQSKKGSEKIKEVDNIIRKIPKAPKIANIYDLFDKAWDWIANNESLTETKKGKRRIKLSWSGKYRVLTNFPLFQPRYDIEKQKSILMGLLGLKEIEDKLLIYIDKATSKFLPSLSDFPNIPYTKSCITIYDLCKLNPKAPIFILTYPLAFIADSKLLVQLKHQLMVYSPNLEFTYSVNKKLRKYIEKSEQDGTNIFKVTWRSIIDSLTEVESIWSLESMYMIKIKPPVGQKQDFENVEYIGISKLQASILIDDPVREALNIEVPVGKDEKYKNKDKLLWILEEFIKNKSLYDLISKHIYYCLRAKNGKGIYRKASLYALAIDAKIKENNQIDLFSDKFFEGYRSLVNEIKDCYSTLNSNAIKISQLYNSLEERRQISYTLVSALKKRNRIAFVNTLLKKFLENAGSKEVLQLNRFVFENIVSNDVSWENYALALVIGILSGGEVESDESESEE